MVAILRDFTHGAITYVYASLLSRAIIYISFSRKGLIPLNSIEQHRLLGFCLVYYLRDPVTAVFNCVW
jgi:hypothetical protein